MGPRRGATEVGSRGDPGRPTESPEEVRSLFCLALELYAVHSRLSVGRQIRGRLLL